MFAVFAEFSRFGVDRRHAVARTYLPTVAAHNLALVARLVGTSASTTVPSTSLPPSTTARLPLADRLDAPASLSFRRMPLSDALEMLAADLDVTLEIDNTALEREGITRNQSFDLDLKDRPAREILVQILLRASPKGQLVYILDDDESGEESLRITTRPAAVAAGDPLPPDVPVASDGDSSK